MARLGKPQDGVILRPNAETEIDLVVERPKDLLFDASHEDLGGRWYRRGESYERRAAITRGMPAKSFVISISRQSGASSSASTRSLTP